MSLDVIDTKAVRGEPVPPSPKGRSRPRRPIRKGDFIMAAVVIVVGAYLLIPTLILLVMSLNTAPNILVDPWKWGTANWSHVWSDPRVGPALWNSVSVWFWVSVISLPVAVGIALLLSRTNIYLSRALEFGFWVAYIFPSLAATYGWIDLLAPQWGFLNRAVATLPGVESGPFNVYSFWGIVFVRLMTDGIAFFVILLTPIFRNMDGSLEEAARISGMSGLMTSLRVTLPIMVAPIFIVAALQLIKFFQGFEVEYLLGSQFGYYVYSTLIYQMVYVDPDPQYANAVVLASITLIAIAAIIPLQRWIVHRKQYTTVASAYRASLIPLGRLRSLSTASVATLLIMLTIVPTLVVGVGSFMLRVGFFTTKPLWTTDHWRNVLSDPTFTKALLTTLLLAGVSAVVSPILFSLFAYAIVRTRWRGRAVLDGIIWTSAALPGILLGFGLLIMFLVTPGLKLLFGTIWPLIIVLIFAGITTGTNVFKGVLVQLHDSLEEAARVSGAGWLRTYLRVVIPILRPTMVLVGMLSFVHAANTTASIILLASRETTTLSIMSLQLGAGGRVEEGGIISLIIMALSLGLALPVRLIANRRGLPNDQSGVAAPTVTTEEQRVPTAV
jgi:iron(III) transport system permease protein